MKQIELTQGLFALVNEEDFEYLNKEKWCAMNLKKADKIYAVRRHKNKIVYMHRVILNPEKGMVIDHIDRNGLNNTRDNIRACTPSQNQANRRVWIKKTSSRFLGVIKHQNGWLSSITKNRIRMTIGCFKDEIEAAKAYNEAAIKHHGEFATLNTF